MSTDGPARNRTTSRPSPDGPAAGYLLIGTLLDPVSPRRMRMAHGAAAIGARTESIREIGPVEAMKRRYEGWPVIDRTDHVILPAFADGHARLVEYGVRSKSREASSGGLLGWWNQVVYPEEARFAKDDYARKRAQAFFDGAAAVGSLGGFLVGPPQPSALGAVLEIPEAQRWHCGNVVSDGAAPAQYRASTSEAIGLLEDSAFRFGRRYVVSPRAVPACSDELLQTAGLLGSDGEVWTQVPIAVSQDEVDLIRTLMIARPSKSGDTSTMSGGNTVGVLSALRRAKLLGQRTVLAGCAYLDEADWRTVSAFDCLYIHTPAADDVFGAPSLPLDRVNQYGIRWALGSAAGVSPSLSMLWTMQAFLRQQGRQRDREMLACEALWRATAALPQYTEQDYVGRIDHGYAANLVIFDAPDAANAASPDRCLRALCEGRPDELEARAVTTLHRGHVAAGAPIGTHALAR